jgi:hypothetical protein
MAVSKHFCIRAQWSYEHLPQPPSLFIYLHAPERAKSNERFHSHDRYTFVDVQLGHIDLWVLTSVGSGHQYIQCLSVILSLGSTRNHVSIAADQST